MLNMGWKAHQQMRRMAVLWRPTPILDPTAHDVAPLILAQPLGIYIQHNPIAED
jgi:hypothetical protein